MSELFKITSVADKKKVFDLSGFKTENGSSILSYKDLGQANQKFYFSSGYIFPWLDKSKCVSVNPKDSTLFLWEKKKDMESFQRWIYSDKTFRTPSSGKYICTHTNSSKLTVEELDKRDIKRYQFNLVETSADLKSKFTSVGLGIGKFFSGGSKKKGGGFSAPPPDEVEIKKRTVYPEVGETEVEKFQYWTCNKMVVGVLNSRIGLFSNNQSSSVEHMWSFRKDGFIVYSDGGYLDVGIGHLILNMNDPNVSKGGNVWEKKGAIIVHKPTQKVLAFSSEGNELVLEEEDERKFVYQTFQWKDELEIEEQIKEQEKEVFDVYFQPPTFDQGNDSVQMQMPQMDDTTKVTRDSVNKLLESGMSDLENTQYSI